MLFRIAAAVLFLSALAGHARAQSPLDDFDPNANGAVSAIVVQPDGKILIGGDFTTLSPNGGATVIRNHIARLNPEGTPLIRLSIRNVNSANSTFFQSHYSRRQNFCWRRFHIDRRTGAQPYCPPRTRDGTVDPRLRSKRLARTARSSKSSSSRTAISSWGLFTTIEDSRATISLGCTLLPGRLIHSTRMPILRSVQSPFRRTVKLSSAARSPVSEERRAEESPGSIP